jgi:hypothetical protein
MRVSQSFVAQLRLLSIRCGRRALMVALTALDIEV